VAITDIAFTSYPAKNVGKLADFYQSTLGLTLDTSMGEGDEMQFAQFKVGSNWFSVITDQWANKPAGQQCSMMFEVEDIDKTLGELRAKGVKTDDKPYDTPVCRIASFEDPEGNSVGLHQITAAH